MLVRDRRTRSANGAFGRHERHESGDEACHRSVVVTIECAQVDRIDRSASRASYPQEPIACPDGGADRGRKDHGRADRLALVPGVDQEFGILKHLGIGRAPGCRFPLRGFTLLTLQFSLVEAYARIVIE